MKWSVTKGYVKIRLDEAVEEVDGFTKIDADVNVRFGEVVDMGEPFSHIGVAKYKIGSRVMIPQAGGYYFEQEGVRYVILLQSEVYYYEE